MADCCGGLARVSVEFEYLVVEGQTCDRCGDSREGVRAAVRDARAMLAATTVEIEYIERELDTSRVADSNRVLVNGLPAEEWLGGTAATSDCPSCSDLLGESTCCRAVEVGGVHTDAISRELVLDAIMAAAGLAPAGVPGENCCGAAEGAASVPSRPSLLSSEDSLRAGGPPAEAASDLAKPVAPCCPSSLSVVLVTGPGCG